MREYELMLVLDPTLDEAGEQGATERVQSFVTAHSGEMLGIDPMGRRRLAYPIERHRDGIYTIARFKMAPSAADELERGLKLNDQVLRHMLIRKD